MIRRLLLPVVLFAVAGSAVVTAAGPAAASATLKPETISAGGLHTCALDTAGKAWCWGADYLGQAGDGAASQADKYSPVKVAGARVFTTINAGGAGTCALDTAGTAWCWGFGQLVGDGTLVEKYSPVRVAGGRAFSAISVGGSHACALDTAGKAWCWGDDTEAAVGDGNGTSGLPVASPVKVAGDRVFTTISAGGGHTCALGTAGKAWCWGNGGPWIGDGDRLDDDSPVRVAGDRAFTSISAGGGTTCALGTAGKAWCWGRGGEAGDGTDVDRWMPVRVAGDRVFTTISAGSGHTCALSTAGKAWCWGYTVDGAVGDGGGAYDEYATAPVRVAGDRVFKAISAGNQHTCALGVAGKAWCWGTDTLGQVGDGDANQNIKYQPVRVAGDRVWLQP